MLSFIICDDDIHMINKLSLLFEKAFMKNDFDAKQELQNVRAKTIWELEKLLKKVINMKRAMTMLDNVCH